MSDLIYGSARYGYGKAVFANRVYLKGEKIFDFTGPLCAREELPAERDHFVQISPDLFMGPSGDFDDIFNHSCDPNGGLVFGPEGIALVAVRDIQIGEEIAWDYSTTMDEDGGDIDCLCQSYNCRGRVRDFKYLPPAIQHERILQGVVPHYVLLGLKRHLKVHSLKRALAHA